VTDERRPSGACKNADGTEKRAYHDRAKVKKIARESRKRYGNPLLTYYKCQFGEHYHIGNNDRKRA
jgi:hypothetical protein